MSNDLCGVINIYKEKGYTSHDVVNIVRNSLNKVKTGHTGTLDPEAEGVLPICIGKATKIADYISSDLKEYIAEITFGVSTDTQDYTGKVLSENFVLNSEDEIIKAILSFKGVYEQIPPMYSALKINGKKLYEIARSGSQVERKKRSVNIYEIKILELNLNKNKGKFSVLCSKGTYIRTLCDDIGKKLGCGAHMSGLLRTRAGEFYLNDSIKINQFKSLSVQKKYSEFLLPVDFVLSGFKKVYVYFEANKFLYNGNKINIEFVSKKNLDIGESILVYDSQNKLVGIYKAYNDFIKPLIMLI